MLQNLSHNTIKSATVILSQPANPFNPSTTVLISISAKLVTYLVHYLTNVCELLKRVEDLEKIERKWDLSASTVAFFSWWKILNTLQSARCHSFLPIWPFFFFNFTFPGFPFTLLFIYVIFVILNYICFMYACWFWPCSQVVYCFDFYYGMWNCLILAKGDIFILSNNCNTQLNTIKYIVQRK